MLTGLPAGLTARPLRPDDAAAWARLQAAAEEVDRFDEHQDEADCAEELAGFGERLPQLSVAVFDGDEAVAYQVCHDLTGPLGRRWVSVGAVHPRHRRRGLGTAVLRHAEATLRAAGGGVLAVRPFESDVGANALAAELGMTPVRWWSDLSRDLSAPVDVLAPPAGVRIVALGPPYDAARWDEPLRRAHNLAFERHWGSVPVEPPRWASRYTGTRALRPACSAAALDEHDDVVGYLLTHEFEPGPTGERDAYLDTIGVVPARHGRGIGGALVAAALVAAVGEGFATASLTVDADNASGAVGLYTRVGFREVRRATTFHRDVPGP